MAGGDGREWFARAAERYRESWEHAPPESWGRPIGAIKARLLAGDWDGAADDARWALESGAAESSLRSAATPRRSRSASSAGGTTCASRPITRASRGFPSEVADALMFIAAEDMVDYVQAVEAVLESFETRDEYLEDMPVADTVLVLQALAARRGIAAELESELLP